MASISCRRRFQTRCAVHLSAIAIFSVATTARRVGGKYQNTAQPEVYLSLNRSLANRLLTAESTYFEKERVACLFCIIVVVSSATGKGHPLTSRWHLSLALGVYHCAAEDDGYKPDREDVVISRC